MLTNYTMYSINLLDPQRKLVLYERIRTRRVVLLFLHVLLVALVEIAALLTFQIMLSRRQTAILDQFATTKIVAGGKTLPVAQTVKQLNTHLQLLKPKLTDTPVEVFLADVSGELPAGITLSNLTLSVKAEQLTVKGTAKTRNDVPAYQRALESLTALSQVRTESNLNERTNISFTTSALVDFSKIP